MRKYIFVCCLILILTACHNTGYDKDNTIKVSNSKDCSTISNCTLVYDSFEMLLYDTKKKDIISPLNPENDVFQYTLYDDNHFITSGKTGKDTTTPFTIYQNINNQKLLEVYQTKDKHEGIYPFAIIDGEPIFLVLNHQNNEQSFKGIYRLLEDELILITKNDQGKNIYKGISTNNIIYFLSYDESSDIVNIYKTDKELKKFELIAEDIDSSEISTLNDEVCYTKGNKFICNNTTDFSIESGVVITKLISNKFLLKIKDDHSFSITDISKNTVIGKGKDYIGYQVEEYILKIYSNGHILELEL